MAGGLELQLCSDINAALRNHDASHLQRILVLEPPFTPIYDQLISSLQSTFPKADPSSTTRLEAIVRATVREADEGQDAEGRPVPSWGAMVTFVAAWMGFLRDLDVGNLLGAYEGLSELLQKASSALQHAVKGMLLLPTIVGYAKIFARVAMGLDKHPELIQHLVATTVTEEGRRESLSEKAANIVRHAFVTCLNDKNTVPGGIKNGKPDGKKAGIYRMANVCLSILFQADKLENCKTIFSNIANSAPPLHFYPASQRVAYLYYLGRFLFASSDFFQAQLVFQEAYDTAHPSCRKQRRRILIYLLAANIILGRFPAEYIYSQPEAHGLRDVFFPITQAIRRGHLEDFRRITDLDLTYRHAHWMCHYRIFYHIAKHCEVLCWRSLFRRVFLLTGQVGPSERSAPTLDLNAVLAAFLYFEKRALMSPAMAQADSGPGRRHITFVLQDFTPRSKYVDPDFEGLGLEPYNHMPDLEEIECICGSLITQGFLNGYISHKMKKFAIQGARQAGSASKAGFPVVFDVFRSNNVDAGRDQVEGWVKERRALGGPNVVRLAGARAAGT